MIKIVFVFVFLFSFSCVEDPSFFEYDAGDSDDSGFFLKKKINIYEDTENSDKDSDSDADVDSDSDSDVDSDSDSDADNDSDADVDSDSDSDADNDVDSDSDSDVDADNDSDTDIDSDSGVYFDSDSESDSYTNDVEFDTDSETISDVCDLPAICVDSCIPVAPINGKKIDKFCDEDKICCLYDVSTTDADTDSDVDSDVDSDTDADTSSDSIDTGTGNNGSSSSVCFEGGYEFPVSSGICWYYQPKLDWEHSDCLNVCRNLDLEYSSETEEVIKEDPDNCISIVQGLGLEGDEGYNYAVFDSCGIGDYAWESGASGCVYEHNPSEYVLHQIKVITCDGDINSMKRSISPRVCSCK